MQGMPEPAQEASRHRSQYSNPKHRGGFWVRFSTGNARRGASQADVGWARDAGLAGFKMPKQRLQGAGNVVH